MFGRESRLPIDCIMPLKTKATTRKTYDKFVREWKARMKQAVQIANKNINKCAASNKQRYDNNIKHVTIDVGDKVLVRNLTPRGGTGKLKSWWEHKIYEVIKKEESVPVYTVKPLDSTVVKVVHRNLLLKVDNLSSNAFGKIGFVGHQQANQFSHTCHCCSTCCRRKFFHRFRL